MGNKTVKIAFFDAKPCDIDNLAETTLKNIYDFFSGRKLEKEVCFNCQN